MSCLRNATRLSARNVYATVTTPTMQHAVAALNIIQTPAGGFECLGRSAHLQVVASAAAACSESMSSVILELSFTDVALAASASAAYCCPTSSIYIAAEVTS
jgi:hypothetical protein